MFRLQRLCLDAFRGATNWLRVPAIESYQWRPLDVLRQSRHVAKAVAEPTSQQDGVIRQQVIEHLMRQIMHYDSEFRREGRPPQSALTRSTDGGSGRRLEYSPIRPHPHAGQAGGSLGARMRMRAQPHAADRCS